MLYVLCKGCDDDVFSVCIVAAWSCRCSCMGSMSVSLRRYCVIVWILWQFPILNDLQFVNAGRGCKRRPYGKGILQIRSHDCAIGSHECLLLFTTSCCCECFYTGIMVCSIFLISVCMFTVSKALLISSATVILRAVVAIWLNPFATVLFNVCSAVTVECCVLYPCCVGVFGMFSMLAVM